MPSATMRAAVLTAPGIENLHVTDLPVPSPEPGQVRIRVMAFGLNRSEYHSVTGQAGGMTYPRVLGIEAVGVIDLDPENVLAAGTQVATMMGGMGRAFDGGYAQYVVVPREQVIPFSSELPWEIIGSVPETVQTAHGSLTTGLGLRRGSISSPRVERRPCSTTARSPPGSETVSPTAWTRSWNSSASHAARLAGGDGRARHGVLHRHAVGLLDDPRLLPDGLDPQRSGTDHLRG